MSELKLNLRKQLICRRYSDTQNKPWVADTLRCREPDNIPDFRVNPEPFAAVIKVCKSKEYPAFRHWVQVMKSCWDIEPRDRPKFRSLITSLESLKYDFDYGQGH